MFTFDFGGGCFTVVYWFDENCRDVGFPGFGFGVVDSGGYGSVGGCLLRVWCCMLFIVD